MIFANSCICWVNAIPFKISTRETFECITIGSSCIRARKKGCLLRQWISGNNWIIPIHHITSCAQLRTSLCPILLKFGYTLYWFCDRTVMWACCSLFRCTPEVLFRQLPKQYYLPVKTVFSHSTTRVTALWSVRSSWKPSSSRRIQRQWGVTPFCDARHEKWSNVKSPNYVVWWRRLIAMR